MVGDNAAISFELTNAERPYGEKQLPEGTSRRKANRRSVLLLQIDLIHEPY